MLARLTKVDENEDHLLHSAPVFASLLSGGSNMTRIVVCVPPLFGPINSTRKVVGDLRRNGHIVHFVGVPECAAILGDDQFSPVFSELFPFSEGTATAADPTAPEPPPLLDGIRGARRAYAIDRALPYRLAAGRNEGFEIAIRTANPDIVIIAANVWHAVLSALLSHRFNIQAMSDGTRQQSGFA